MPGGGGVELARRYSADGVVPLIGELFPGVPIAVARLGSGSDVLGLDDGVSEDHDWGLRLTVVVPAGTADRIDDALERRLPPELAGLPTRFATSWDPRVRHRVEVVTLRELGLARLGADLGSALGLLDWVSLTGQAALEMTAGAVFRDDAGTLTAARAMLATPPDDVRRWAIASCWAKTAEELPFVGRAAERGDATGSRILVARLAQTAMRLGFLLEHRWSPYSKWLGTAFAALPRAGAIAPALGSAVISAGWPGAEAALAAALDGLAELQIRDGLPALVPATRPFFERPFLGCRDIAELVRGTIADPVVSALPLVGPPDLWSDDVRVLTDHGLRRRMTAAILGGPA